VCSRGSAGVVSTGAVELTNSSSSSNDNIEVAGTGAAGGGRVSRGGSPIPPSKALTAEEAEKLASLYK
jgi:hypothetical protein